MQRKVFTLYLMVLALTAMCAWSFNSMCDAIEGTNNLIKQQNKEIVKMRSVIDRQQSRINELDTTTLILQEQITHLKEQNELKLFKASAYTANDAGCNTTTATGTTVTEGRTLSVDPRIIPLGSTVEIKSDFPGVSGVYKAEDTGGGIKGNRLDVFMVSRHRALDFGRRDVYVRIIR